MLLVARCVLRGESCKEEKITIYLHLFEKVHKIEGYIFTYWRFFYEIAYIVEFCGEKN